MPKQDSRRRPIQTRAGWILGIGAVACSWSCGGLIGVEGSGPDGRVTAGGTAGTGGRIGSGGWDGWGPYTGGSGGWDGWGPSGGGSGGWTPWSGGGGTHPACAAEPTHECRPEAFVYFDPTTSLCMPSKPGMCLSEAPGRVFDSLGTCSTCGQPSQAVCDSDVQCTIRGSGCCGPCEPWSLSALRSDHFQWFDPSAPVCDCGACPDIPVEQRTSQFFQAECINHTCEVIDVRESATACTQDDQCFLRAGVECCGSCRESDWIALSSTEFLDGRCGSAQPCEPCEPEPLGAGLRARCGASGHCEIASE